LELPINKYMNFRNWFEVSREELSKVGGRINKFTRGEVSDEPFNDIFGDKYRIVIPILDENERKFYDHLAAAGMKNINLTNGTGDITIKTDKGDKDRPIKIGKFLQQNNNTELLDFWQKNREALSKKREGVSIIVSRHPIDIIRMSDHSEWKSCHAPGRDYFKCAVSEAKHGGAIAYIVRNRDLANINLQAKDIFKDKDRDVDGIEPLERVRLRRFEDENNNYLVPELRTYGIKNVDFYNTVKSWALATQKDKLEDLDYSKLKLRGGSYQDNSASELWNKFVGGNFHGGKTSIDQNAPDKLDDQTLARMIAGHGYRHFGVHAEVAYDRQHDYINYRGGVSFEFPEDLFTDKFQVNNYKISTLIRNNLSIYTINDINYRKHHGQMYIELDIIDTDHDENENELTRFEHFLDYLDDLDGEYAKHKMNVFHALWSNGYVKNPADELELKNLKFVDNSKQRETSYEYESNPQVIGSLLNVSEELFHITNTRSSEFAGKDASGKPVDNYGTIRELLIKLLPDLPEMSPRLLVEREPHPDSFTSRYYTNKPLRKYKDTPVYFEFAFALEDMSHEFLEKVKKVDDDFPKIIERIKDWWHQYTSDTHQGEDKDHPAVGIAIHRLSQWFHQHNQPGIAYLKDGEYWYKDVYGTDMPVKDAYEMILRDNARAKEYEKQLMELGRWGEVRVSYLKGNPVFMWRDRRDNVTKPVEDAIAEYTRRRT